jgi:hypothetical protein
MTRNFFNLKNLVLAALGLVTLGIAAYPALATVTVTPMIAVIEGRNRYADINLINTSDKTESYQITWRFYKMKEGEGTYDNADASLTDFDLSQHLVMTPRRVSIEPGGMQKIRLGLRLKGEPPAPGDYRAHLMLMQDKDVNAAPVPPQPLEKGKVMIGVGVNVGLSIPVVYRVGESDVKAVIGDVSRQINPNSGKIELLIPITREGEGRYGIYGDLKVMRDGEMLGEIANANIFDEVQTRVFKVVLNVSELSGGNLEVIYKHYDKLNPTVFAQKTVPVGR